MVAPNITNTPMPGGKGDDVVLSEAATNAIIAVVPVVMFAFAMIWWYMVSKIEVWVDNNEGNQGSDETQPLAGQNVNGGAVSEFAETCERLHALATCVSEGAETFLFAEYRYMALFMVGFSLIIVLLLGSSMKAPETYRHEHNGTATSNKTVTFDAADGAKKDLWINATLSAVSFLIGCIASIISGWIGMKIAVYTNSRAAFFAFKHVDEANRIHKQSGHDVPKNDEITYSGAAAEEQGKGFAGAFQTAFRGGLVMGFALTSLGVFSLFITILMFKGHFCTVEQFAAAVAAKAAGIVYADSGLANGCDIEDPRSYKQLFESVAAFGLGGSSIACFGRVGGGIYTKAADVGADLVGKVEKDIPEDDPRNPGVLADCVGDNVGDIAGMGSDLFGSFGEATCAALVCSSASNELIAEWSAMMFPLMITIAGLIACFLTSFKASNFAKVTSKKEIEPELKMQLVLSTILTTGFVTLFAYLCLPAKFELDYTFKPEQAPNEHYRLTTTKTAHWGSALVCVLSGLWCGLAIGYLTEYYTSNEKTPTVEVSESCHTGAATNVIYGLALGYLSVIVPVFLMALVIYVSYNLCLLYGFSLAALGILSTMSIGLTIDAYGPIADNAGGLVEMSSMQANVRAITDALDAAGNTTAAIGKGFAISSAAMVGLALYGAFVTRCFTGQVNKPGASEYTVNHGVNIIDGRVLAGLLIGAMLPYWFSALTMKSVGKAALSMIENIRQQFKTPELRLILKNDDWVLNPKKLKEMKTMSDEERARCGIPDYESCIRVSTEASLREMIAPGLLVILSPIVCGIFLGKECLAGMLPGSFVSGVQMAISASNTGGSWDNAKKYIESRRLMKTYKICEILADIDNDATDKAEREGTAAPESLLLNKRMTDAVKETEFRFCLLKTDTDHQKIKDNMAGVGSCTEGERNGEVTEVVAAAGEVQLSREEVQRNVQTMWAQLDEVAQEAWCLRVRQDFKEAKDAAVIGDTIGDPLKDTSGPALNILMKLMAIISVVFAPVVKAGAPLSGVIIDRGFKSFNADSFVLDHV